MEFQEQQFQAFCDDGTMPENYLLNEWWRYVAEGLAVFGKDIAAVLKVSQLMQDAGFINVEEREIKIPLGLWPKDKKLKTVGLYCRTSIEDGLEGLSLGPFVRGKFIFPRHYMSQTSQASINVMTALVLISSVAQSKTVLT